ncbi:hypothetical protein NM688_g1679 [Phlebia brevispora]|uniref:Uncharacterized protein n=1 Tax=Phlebia brevispora TaxID=194682 RepID=A0ACC1TB39_9APHY|nr:hypothetical protein NM688_g1679 [Phlebia brevispora]
MSLSRALLTISSLWEEPQYDEYTPSASCQTVLTTHGETKILGISYSLSKMDGGEGESESQLIDFDKEYAYIPRTCHEVCSALAISNSESSRSIDASGLQLPLVAVLAGTLLNPQSATNLHMYSNYYYYPPIVNIDINVECPSLMPGPSRSDVPAHRRDRRAQPEHEHRQSSRQRDRAPVIPEQHESRASAATEVPLEPIQFYNSDEPYYEFTNFAPVSVRYDGQRYPTAEHLFQAHKFLDVQPHLAERIRKLPTARAALEEASRLQRLQRQDWFEVNIGVMDIVLEAKFRQHRGLYRRLLDTGNRELIEASPVDSFWGVGADGKGRNELGKALMRLRGRMQGEKIDK